MKMKCLKMIAVSMTTTAMCMALTSCGKEKEDASKKVDVSGGYEIFFTGMNGYGTAELTGSYAWIEDILKSEGDDMSRNEIISFQENLRNAVTYTITPSEGISNGDEITVSIDVDNSLVEEYKLRLTGGTATFTADGLDPVEEVDPFAELTITYDGIAPLAKARLDASGMDNTLSYTIDKETGLSNGDVITVTAAPKSSMTMDEYIQKYGKVLTATEQTYTVEGLSSYVASLDDIPQDTLDKMNQTYLDAYPAHIADLGSVTDMELLGNYVLTAKSNASPYNQIYFVYKVTADFTAMDAEDGVQEYYWCAYYENVMMMPDGTLSADYEDLHMGSHDSDMLIIDAWYVEGCKDLDTLYRYNMTEKSGEYDCVSTVK